MRYTNRHFTYLLTIVVVHHPTSDLSSARLSAHVCRAYESFTLMTNNTVVVIFSEIILLLLDVITFQDPFFKIFANKPPVFIISFHLPEIPPLPCTRLRVTTSLPRRNLRTKKYCSFTNFGLHHYQPTQWLLTHSTHLCEHLCTYMHIVCFVCCFYLLFQLHIICCPALGPQCCY